MKVGILAGISRMLHSHSVAQVVREQILMVHEAAHHPVLLAPADLQWFEAPPWLAIRAVLPPFERVKYTRLRDLSEEHGAVAVRAARALRASCGDLDAVFAHDILYNGNNLPLAEGLRLAIGDLPETPRAWLHWIHSVPGERRDFWTLPPRSRLVSPTEANRELCAERFATAAENVFRIPHARDPRSFLLATDLARKIVTEHRVLEAELVQTYPMELDRAMAKGLHQVIAVFAALKALGRSVRLLVADSGRAGPAYERRVRGYREYAEHLGLGEGALVFTSSSSPPDGETLDGPRHGVPIEVVRDLMSVSNLFVYPTKSETFGLVLAEAALSGQLLVLNSDLPVLSEVMEAGTALSFSFGGSCKGQSRRPWEELYRELARWIVAAAERDLALRAKTCVRLTYNRQAVWRETARCLESMGGPSPGHAGW